MSAERYVFVRFMILRTGLPFADTVLNLPKGQVKWCATGEVITIGRG